MKSPLNISVVSLIIMCLDLKYDVNMIEFRAQNDLANVCNREVSLGGIH